MVRILIHLAHNKSAANFCAAKNLQRVNLFEFFEFHIAQQNSCASSLQCVQAPRLIRELLEMSFPFPISVHQRPRALSTPQRTSLVPVPPQVCCAYLLDRLLGPFLMDLIDVDVELN